MGYDAQILFGGLTLYVDSLRPRKIQSTKKQVIGKALRLISIPDLSTQDWDITIRGRHPTATRATNRDTLQSYHDLKTHTLVDGLHDGEYFITALEYDDKGNQPTSYSFTLRLIQKQ